MTLTPGNMNLGFFVNRFAPIPSVISVFLLNPTMNAPINFGTNLSTNVELQPEIVVLVPPIISMLDIEPRI